jgi:hypothetical protein
MCEIAGLIDLNGGDGVPAGVSRCMAEALTHRGPDEPARPQLYQRDRGRFGEAADTRYAASTIPGRRCHFQQH